MCRLGPIFVPLIPYALAAADVQGLRRRRKTGVKVGFPLRRPGLTTFPLLPFFPSNSLAPWIEAAPRKRHPFPLVPISKTSVFRIDQPGLPHFFSASCNTRERERERERGRKKVGSERGPVRCGVGRIKLVGRSVQLVWGALQRASTTALACSLARSPLPSINFFSLSGRKMKWSVREEKEDFGNAWFILFGNR